MFVGGWVGGWDQLGAPLVSRPDPAFVAAS